MDAHDGGQTIPPVLVLGKAVAILDALAEVPNGLTLAEVNRQVGSNRSTTYRILRSLDKHRLIRRTASGRYRLGLKLLELGSSAQRSLELRSAAQPHMEALAERLLVSVFLSMRDGDIAVCVERVDRGSVHIATYQVGTTLPLTVGGGPLLLLAAQTDDEVDRLRQARTRPLTSRTITDPGAILERVRDARREGVVWSDEDVAITMGAVALPILSRDGGTVAAISISSHRDDLLGDGRDRYAAELMAAAEAISREIGYVGAWPVLPLPAEGTGRSSS